MQVPTVPSRARETNHSRPVFSCDSENVLTWISNLSQASPITVMMALIGRGENFVFLRQSHLERKNSETFPINVTSVTVTGKACIALALKDISIHEVFFS